MKLPSLTTFILLAAAIPAGSQTYTAAKIEFDHPGPYTQAQLEAVAGMHAGLQFTADDLSAAAGRLADTGFFSDVGARTMPGMVSAITVQFNLAPIERAQLVHVTFDNFVWLSHAEIEATLQAKASLFLDYIPEGSPLLDGFNDALTSALAAKGIAAKVTHESFEPTLLRPERDVDFRIASPAARVSNVRLGGVSADLAPLIQKSVNTVAGRLYSDGLPGETTEDRILAPLLDAGYIEASLSDQSLAPSVSGDTTSVVLSATLHAGDVYRVSSISFAGTSLLSADSFASTAKLHPGDVASRAKLLETLRPLDAAYRRQGYMDVIAKAAPRSDPTTHQVAYMVTLTPGEQYRIHTVTTNGLDPAAQADFDRGFLMKTGDLYSPEYVVQFLPNNTALLALVGYNATYKAYADPNTHTVDLVLTFVRGGTH